MTWEQYTVFLYLCISILEFKSFKLNEESIKELLFMYFYIRI